MQEQQQSVHSGHKIMYVGGATKIKVPSDCFPIILLNIQRSITIVQEL